VFFAQNSSELTDDAKSALDVIAENTTVEIKGTASPEGSLKYNQELSEKRAAVVKEYLTSRNVNVIDAKGIGVQNSTSNSTAIITIK
jgi:outer membrane protein OmpA-like peptidoglycan-associated protein